MSRAAPGRRFLVLAACSLLGCSSSGEGDASTSKMTESEPAEDTTPEDDDADGDTPPADDDTTAMVDDTEPSDDDGPSGDEAEPVPTPDGPPAPEPEGSVPTPDETDVPVTDPPATALPEPAPAPEPVPMPNPIPPVPGEPVCADSCGNGVIDSCEVCTDAFGTPLPAGVAAIAVPCFPPSPGGICPPVEPVCTTYTEPCDGAPSSDQSCESIGYTSGTLGCSDACNLDAAGCSSCPADERFVACDDRVGDVEDAAVVALATKGDSIGLAWSSAGSAGFGRFDTDLALLSRTDELSPSSTALALATLPSGWLMAAGSSITVLDEEGGVVSTRAASGHSAMFASTGSDTPLIVSSTASSAVATLLDGAGEEVWQTPLLDDVLEPHYGSAVAVSGGFLVALRSSANGVQVFRLDGETGELTGVNALGSGSTEYPQLASNGTSARAVWADFSGTPSVYFGVLDDAGQSLGEPTLLGGTPDYFNRSPIRMLGEDTLVLFGGYTGGTGQGQALHARRVDGTGATLYGDVRVQNDPNSVVWPQLSPLGDEMVVAWVTVGQPGRLGLAKFTP